MADSSPSWTKQSCIQLLQRVQEQSCTATKSVDWSEVAFDTFSDQDCKAQYVQLRSQAFRSLDAATETKIILSWLETANVKQNRAVHNDFPKKPISSYFIFLEKKREHYKRKFPELKASELAAKLGEIWQAMPPEKKSVYAQLVQEGKEQYQQELHKYYDEHPDELPSTSAGTRAKAELPEIERAKRDLPPKPKSAFELFCDVRVSEYEDSGKDEQQIRKKLRKRWKKLDDAGKQPFVSSALKQEAPYILAVRALKSKYPMLPIRVPTIGDIANATYSDVILEPPAKVGTSAYTFFSTEKMRSDPHVRALPFAERGKAVAALYHSLNAEEKARLTEEFLEAAREYQVKATEYLSSIDDQTSRDLARYRIGFKARKTKNPAGSPGKKAALVNGINGIVAADIPSTSGEGKLKVVSKHKKLKLA